jgi:Tol biopolymer transport system component
LLDYFGGVWTKGNDLIFVGPQPRGLWRVPAGGGTPQNIVPKVRLGGKETERGIAWPDLLPGERSVLVSDWDDQKLAVVDLETRDMVPLDVEGTGGRFAANGYVVYSYQTELRGIAFDPVSRRVGQAPLALIQDIAYARNKAPVFAFSDEGTLVLATGHLRGSNHEPMSLIRVAEDQKPTPLAIQPQLIGRGFALSADGSRLALGLSQSPVVVWMDLRRGTIVKLEDTGLREAASLAWTPDGRQLAVSGSVPGRGWWGVNLKNVDGTGKAQPFVVPENIEIHLAGWTPDGQTLIGYGGPPMQTKMEIMRMQRDKPRDVIHIEPGRLSSARVSPDGQWLAYDSSATGMFQIYVLRLTGQHDRIPVTADGGTAPLWSPDGRKLLFRRAGAIFSVPVTTVAEGSIDFGGERRLFAWDTTREWAIAPSGEIYSSEPVPGAALQTSFFLRTGWFAELNHLIRREPPQ